MKKLLVLSDSHGVIDNMVFAVKKTAPTPQQIVTSAGPSQVEAPEELKKSTKNDSTNNK